MEIARHVSPDGQLVWVVEEYPETEGSHGIAMGFADLPWHTHPDAFDRRGRSDHDIATDVTAAILTDRVLIMTTRYDDVVEHGFLDDLELQVEIKSLDEQWSFRFWSGRQVTIEELIDGTVSYLPFGDA